MNKKWFRNLHLEDLTVLFSNSVIVSEAVDLIKIRLCALSSISLNSDILIYESWMIQYFITERINYTICIISTADVLNGIPFITVMTLDSVVQRN